MTEVEDSLSRLNGDLPLGEKLRCIHRLLSERFDFIDRISVVLYEPKTRMLRTYIETGGDEPVLAHYELPLDDIPSLKAVCESGRPRVVRDLSVFGEPVREHTRRIAVHYRASYTLPMFSNGEFFGFAFFDSGKRDPFTDDALHYLNLFGHLIALLFISDVSAVRTLAAAVKTAREMAQHRDVETGAHLDRMAHYARLIARELAYAHALDDEYIERVFLFAPLHDIGKIAVPDRILLKPGRLDHAEYEIMKTHTATGRRIIDTMLDEFGLSTLQQVDVLRNIAELHHEAMDGSGYPHGLRDGDIPLEARIIAVADVFDALTSERPYKARWSNGEAFAALRRMAGSRLDAGCVAALAGNPDAVERIQVRFTEDRYA